MRSTEMIEKNELVKGKDYFQFPDGRYFTTEALMKIWNCSDSNITQKVARFNISKEKVFERWVYKDDIRFEKGKPGGNNGGKPFVKGDKRIKKIANYATLCARVETMNANLDILVHSVNRLMREFNISNGHLDAKSNDPQKD